MLKPEDELLHLPSPHVRAVKVVDSTPPNADAATTSIVAIPTEPGAKCLAGLLRRADFGLQIGGALVDHLQL
jgi:hypothetical protein